MAEYNDILNNNMVQQQNKDNTTTPPKCNLIDGRNHKGTVIVNGIEQFKDDDEMICELRNFSERVRNSSHSKLQNSLINTLNMFFDENNLNK